MMILVLGLVLFIGTHAISIFADDWRNSMVARIGQNAWRAIYSVVSLLGLGLVFVGYGMARADPLIVYQPPFVLRYLALALLLSIFPLLLSAYLQGRISTAAKHRTLLAVKLWATAHLLVNGSLADVVLFGSVLAWAVADRIALKRRPAKATSSVNSWAMNDTIAVIGGLGIYVGFVLGVHLWLTGMPIVLPW
jgi:uncharacterized membrane protein